MITILIYSYKYCKKEMPFVRGNFRRMSFNPVLYLNSRCWNNMLVIAIE